MKFKVGDLITGTSNALGRFQDLDLSDQAVLEVTSVDENNREYYCKIISNEVDDSNVGDSVCFYEYDAIYFVHKKAVNNTEQSWMDVAEVAFKIADEKMLLNPPKNNYAYIVNPKITSSRLSSKRLFKAKGLI